MSEEITIEQGKSFQRELKKLVKKYPSLPQDLEVLESLIKKFPLGEDSKHCNALKQEGDQGIYKRRLMCRSVKSSEFRVIYYYNGTTLVLEYLEIYYKGNKENEDKKRVETIWEERVKS